MTELKKRYAGHIFIFAVFLHGCSSVMGAKCGECMPNGVACIDDISFATCYEDTPTDNLILCPNGGFCTDNAAICSSAPNAMPICQEEQCGNCALSNGRFACVNETSYGFCYGASQPDKQSEHICPFGYICSYKSAQICTLAANNAPSCISAVAQSTTTLEPVSSSTVTSIETTTYTSVDTTDSTVTTANPTIASTTTETTTTVKPTTTETTTTTKPTTTESTTTTKATTVSSTLSTAATSTSTAAPRDPNTFCAAVKRDGYFRADGDATCQKYIFCYQLSNQWLGRPFVCAGYFNAATGSCQKDKPADC